MPEAARRYRYVGWILRLSGWPLWQIACKSHEPENSWLHLDKEFAGNEAVIDWAVLEQGQHPMGPSVIEVGESVEWDGRSWDA